MQSCLFYYFWAMKNIQIKAKDFFEFLKERDSSMWAIFAQMVDGEEKLITFLDEESKPLFEYKLPATVELLKEDQKTFAKEYQVKMAELN